MERISESIRKAAPGDKALRARYLGQRNPDGEEQLEPLWEEKASA